MEDFAAVLIEARARVKLTQAEVASAAGLTPSYLSFLENRKKPPPSDDVCRRLAKALQLPEGPLLERAHMERAPAPLQRKMRSMEKSLKRERTSRARLLERLLSPFLFAGPPGYLDSAIDLLGYRGRRKKRLKEVLIDVGRYPPEATSELSKIIEALPDSERRLLLEALPHLLASSSAPPASAGDVPEAKPSRKAHRAPRMLFAAPLRSEAPPEPYLLEASRELCAGFEEIQTGDLLLVDPRATPRSGDHVLFAGEGGTTLKRILEVAGEQPVEVAGEQSVEVAGEQSVEVAGGQSVEVAGEASDQEMLYRLSGGAQDPAPGSGGAARGYLPAVDLRRGQFIALWGAAGAGVVVEVRRPLRPRTP